MFGPRGLFKAYSLPNSSQKVADVHVPAIVADAGPSHWSLSFGHSSRRSNSGHSHFFSTLMFKIKPQRTWSTFEFVVAY
jgi:hypothetical protein